VKEIEVGAIDELETLVDLLTSPRFSSLTLKLGNVHLQADRFRSKSDWRKVREVAQNRISSLRRVFGPSVARLYFHEGRDGRNMEQIRPKDIQHRPTLPPNYLHHATSSRVRDVLDVGDDEDEDEEADEEDGSWDGEEYEKREEEEEDEEEVEGEEDEEPEEVLVCSSTDSDLEDLVDIFFRSL